MSNAYLLIGLGAFVGANVRYVIATWATRRYAARFPYGTLIVNLAGCLIIGLVVGVLTARFADDRESRLFVVTGFLGAETTFSTFAAETVALLRAGQYWQAWTNLALSVGLGLGSTMLGLAIADVVTGGAW